MKLSPFAFGTLLTGVGVLILSPDAALIRQVNLDPYSYSVWRGAAMFAVMLLCLGIAFRGQMFAQIRGAFTPAGLTIAALMSTITIAFVLGSEQGDPAFTVVAVAATPLSAALWSWALYREAADRPTIIAMIIGIFAVCLCAYEVVGDQRGNMLGFASAIYIPIGLGLGFTLTRYLPDGQSPWGVYVFAGIFTSALGLTILAALGEGAPDVPPLGEMPILLVSILVVSAGSFVLVSLGPRYISAAQTSLMLLLETALSPVFVYLLEGLAPGPLTLIGGLILILTLIGQTLVQLRLKSQPAQTDALHGGS